MIKRTALVVLSLFFSVLSMSAQSRMSVSSFRPLENDLAANTPGLMEKDKNGDVAALIKIQTTQTGFEFEAGSLGVVKTVQQTGEIWVYVPRGSLRLTVKHPQLGVLRDYYYPCPIEAGRTYELILVSGEVVTTVKKDKGGDMLAVTVQPNSANLYIDDRSVPLENGQFTGFYTYGEHSYRVERSGYNSEAGHFTITSEGTTRLDISLESAFATIRVECQTEGSEIYINQQKKGAASYSEEVLDGTYLIEVRKQGYRTYQETVTLAEKEQRTVSVPALTPIYGSLMANYKPVNADIYIDGVKRGSSPEIIEDILVGEHEVRISMKGYVDWIEQLIVVENEQVELVGSLEIIPKTTILADVSPLTSNAKGPRQNSSSINGHEYVDLGLPSGLLWATCNVGASSPSEYGDYYAWGETSTKSSYLWSNLKYCNDDTGGSFSKYSQNQVGTKGRLELSDDSANANWGDSWRIPSRREWEEIKTNCIWIWTSQDGHNGYKVEGMNGNSIFLPAAGIRTGSRLFNAGEAGYYWSNSLCKDCSYCAYSFFFSSKNVNPLSYDQGYNGQSIRPVSPSR